MSFTENEGSCMEPAPFVTQNIRDKMETVSNPICGQRHGGEQPSNSKQSHDSQAQVSSPFLFKDNMRGNTGRCTQATQDNIGSDLLNPPCEPGDGAQRVPTC